jgi:hypothetical protein
MGALTHNGDVISGLPSTASQINYDNTDSGMAATQVQAAVDELNSNKQPKTDNNLQTTSKETTGAINELKNELTGKQNSYSTPVKIGEIAIGETSIGVVATKTGYISLVYEMNSVNMNIKGRIRDANMAQLGASFDIVAGAYTSEPICTIPSFTGQSYAVVVEVGHNGISIYQF